METARGLLELTRPINALVAGVLTLVGAFVAGGTALGPIGAAVGATILATAGGNAINDYFDREIDRINAPERPIPRGAVSPRLALGFSLGLFGGAVVAALTLPPVAIAIAGVNLLALVSYTSLFKGRPGAGNVIVGLLGGSTFPFGAAAVGRLDVTVGVLFVLAALSTITREIIKDVEDMAGDRAEGLRTLPIVIGRRQALHLAAVVLAVAILASPLPYLRGELGWPYLLIVGPAVGVMAAAMVRSYRDPTAGQSWLKYGMFLAVVAFIVGRSAAVFGGFG